MKGSISEWGKIIAVGRNIISSISWWGDIIETDRREESQSREEDEGESLSLREIMDYLVKESKNKHDEIMTVSKDKHDEIMGVIELNKKELRGIHKLITERYDLFGILMAYLSALITGLTIAAIVDPLSWSSGLKSGASLLGGFISAIVFFYMWWGSHKHGKKAAQIESST